MNLKCKINGIEYKNLVQGFNLSEEYNETLDSASIILSDVKKIDLKPYDDVFIYDGEFNGYGDGYTLPDFFLHFLVDQFTEEMINPSENADDIKYKYKIDLFSETKKLETIQLPNFSITQPLDINKKKTVYQYMLDIIDLYNPLYKVGNNKTWHYEKKYKLDSELENTFNQVYSPDFSLNNPNLRDVLTKLMMTKDMIPVVKNDIITAWDISARNGEFNVDTRYITSIVGSRSSDNHCDGLKRTYNNALSQDNTCKMVEFLGFRNSESGMLTLENLRLETRYPIYKINKIYMCYYKKIRLIDNNNNYKGERIFLCKQDITKFVKLNSERNLLSEDWIEFNEKAEQGMTVDEITKYKIATIGYDIGSNYITGWGTKYSYLKNAFFNTNVVVTYIENVLKIVDLKTPYGIYNYGYITQNSVSSISPEYKISGSYGELKDRVVNVYSNLSLFMKSLFFEVEYNAFYNGTVIHSKDIDRDDIVINDNSGSSLTLLEQDGIFQKEKVNRFGNKTIQINATYDSFDELQKLGSVYNYAGDTDVIIYHREITISDNLINCVYYGSKDYVLKNYFTSVNAKHRPFNLLSYSESVRRSENKKMYILMSKDKYYFENENKILNIDNSFIDNFLSFYKETELGLTKGDFRFENKINYGYLTYKNKYYASDINAFASGNSLCFNISMYDNVSGGLYLDKERKEPEMKDGNGEDYDDYIKGSIQEWYFTSDEETGFSENMGFYVAHFDNDNMFFNKKVLEDEDVVKEVIENKIFSLPKIEIEEDKMLNVIGNDFKINKDNKELIDMTYQFELLSDNDDILFSSWALRLSELLGNYLKFGEDKTANDVQNAETSFRRICTTAYNNIKEDDSLNIKTRDLIMILEFSEDSILGLTPGPFKTKFEFDVDRSEEAQGDWRTKQVIYYSFEVTNVLNYDAEQGYLLLAGKQKVIEDGGFLSNKNTPYPDYPVTLTFRRIYRVGNTDVPEGKIWYSNCSVNYKTSLNNEKMFDVTYFGANNTILYDSMNKSLTLDGINVFFSTKTTYGINDVFDERVYEYKDEYFIEANKTEETIYSQNLFVTTSSEKIKKENVYDELFEISNKITYSPNEIFSIVDNPNGNGGKCLRINCTKGAYHTGVDGIVRPAQSISVWYKDELKYENNTEGLISKGEKGYHFVFGINTGFITTIQKYIYINLSLLSLKDRRVFDNGHNLIGYVKNEANSTELVSTQNYVKISNEE